MFEYMNRVGAFFFSLIIMVCSIVGIPTIADGEELDLSGYELLFEDEFDSEDINEEYWSPHLDSGTTKTRHGGYWNAELAEVKNGILHIYTKYLEEGVNEGDPAGWYSAAFDTNNKFEIQYGYYEVRAKCPKGVGQWAAFWLLGDNMCNIDGSGEDGSEIDILESAFYHKSLWKNRVSHCVHYDGYASEHKSTVARQYLIEGDPYTEYHTYGLEWNEDEYIFYIDGIESYRTSYGGTPKTSQYMILSVEVGGAGGVPGISWAGPAFTDHHNENYVTDFAVDYVRVYQKK